MKTTIYLFLAIYLVAPTCFASDSEDLGQNYHFEEVKDKKRTIASEPKVAKPDVSPISDDYSEDEESERSLASDAEQEPEEKGVKYWKFNP